MGNKEKNIIQAQLEVYRENFLKHGNSPLGTRQNDSATQFLRFERLIKNLNFPSDTKNSIHDIGSGICDMYEFLLEKKIHCEYSGTEIVQEMIHFANIKFPDIKLYNRNILTEKIDESYDYVVLSGLFNMPGDVSDTEWRIFTFEIIEKMFKMSKKAISFNFLTTYKTFTDTTLFYLSLEDVSDFCIKNLSRFLTIDHSYALFEYTVTVFQKDYIKSQYNDPLFDKYFK